MYIIWCLYNIGDYKWYSLSGAHDMGNLYYKQYSLSSMQANLDFK